LATTQPIANVSHWITHPKTWKLNYKNKQNTLIPIILREREIKGFLHRELKNQISNFVLLKNKTKIFIIVRGGSE